MANQKEQVVTAFANAFLKADISKAPVELLDKFVKSAKKFGTKEVQGWNASVSYRTAEQLKKDGIL